MDGFGHEVAKKIKSAIKAKLVELDAYVDDELPDYIMVMVANKKPKSQMTDDLSLFLGDNATKFTSWLHEVLERLQAVTVGENQRKSERSDAKTDQPEKQNQPENEAVSTSEKPKTDESNSVALEGTEMEAVSAEGETQDEFLAIKPDAECDDLLDAELRDEIIVSKETVATKKKISPKKPLDNDDQNQNIIQIKPFPAVAKPDQNIERPTTVSEAGVAAPSSSVVLQTEIEKTSEVASQNGQQPLVIKHRVEKKVISTKPVILNRKRRAPFSTVGAVVKREFPQEEEDEEYDPRHPTIGSVASVVQITQRRSSVPPGLQANKLLLLKAVDEAQRSILQSNLRSTQLSSSVSARKAEQYQPTVRHLTRRNGRKQMSGQILPAERQVGSRKPDLISSSLPSKTLSVRTASQEPERSLMLMRPLPELPDEEEAIGVEEAIEVDEVGSTIEEPEVKDATRYTAVNDDEAAGETEEQQMRRVILLQNKRKEKQEDPPLSPKFIITLDGVNCSVPEDQWEDYNDSLSVNEDVDMNAYYGEYEPEKATEVIYTTQREGYGDGQDDQMTCCEDYHQHDHRHNRSESGVMIKKLKLNERCRYWPACKLGAQCTYHHPTTTCKAFPKCKFGSQCLYIHPNCKFDASCKRRNCPYTHASLRSHAEQVAVGPPRRLALPPTSPKIQCRNYPKCNNVDCTFYHPMPCRYGRACSRKNDCSFFHPPLPSKDKLKWSKSDKDQKSDRQMEASKDSGK